MSKREIDTALAAAYPVSRAEIEDLALDAADHELIAAIVAEPQEAPAIRPETAGDATAVSHTPKAGAWRSRKTGRYGGLLAAGACAAAIFLIVIGTGGGPASGPAPAYGAELLRMAEISPHILLEEPGWRIVVAEVAHATEGMTDFHRGSGSEDDAGPIGSHPHPQRYARFRWHSTSVAKRTREITAHGGVNAGTAAVLGTTAQVYTYPPRGGNGAEASAGEQSAFEATALWNRGGRAFEFRTTVPDIAAFERRLADLRSVGSGAWLAAIRSMELSLVGSSLARVLKGETSSLKNATLVLRAQTPMAMAAGSSRRASRYLGMRPAIAALSAAPPQSVMSRRAGSLGHPSG